ncbi:unnamed protein product [Brucella canis str. Oliveri]|nr:unnamed protein product [Brucella canis str. Oliveri]
MKHISTCMFTLALGGFAMGTAM